MHSKKRNMVLDIKKREREEIEIRKYKYFILSELDGVCERTY